MVFSKSSAAGNMVREDAQMRTLQIAMTGLCIALVASSCTSQNLPDAQPTPGTTTHSSSDLADTMHRTQCLDDSLDLQTLKQESVEAQVIAFAHATQICQVTEEELLNYVRAH